MLWKVIKKDRLNKLRNQICQLNFLKFQKIKIMNTYGLKAIDYSAVKVTTGNGKKMTEQERAAINVEKYDRKIKELEALIQPERMELAQQIERVDGISNNWRHAEALRNYYYEGRSKSESTYSLYGDFDKQNIKNFSEILKTACELLEKVSSTPFIEVEQRTIEDW